MQFWLAVRHETGKLENFGAAPYDGSASTVRSGEVRTPYGGTDCS
jgi:hypothetical protein